MARLLGKPEGEAGRAVGERLNHVNADITAAVYQRLLLRQGDHVLEIGFGNGRLLPALLAYAHDLTYVGIDIAETMVTEAIAFNAELVAAGIASFRLASAEAIPRADESFDRVFAINVIYFWPDPVRALSEMRRVLRPGAMSAVAALVRCRHGEFAARRLQQSDARGHVRLRADGVADAHAGGDGGAEQRGAGGRSRHVVFSFDGCYQKPGQFRLRTGGGRIGRDIAAAAAPHR